MDTGLCRWGLGGPAGSGRDCRALGPIAATGTLANGTQRIFDGSSSNGICLSGGASPEVLFANSRNGRFSVMTLLGLDTFEDVAVETGVFNISPTVLKCSDEGEPVCGFFEGVGLVPYFSGGQDR